MAQIEANGIALEYDTFGKRSDRALLLVMGFGAQMIHWDEEFCGLLAGSGHFVIRYDNRDVGLSRRFEECTVPDISTLFERLQAGEIDGVPYDLNDMAADGIGLLSALGIDHAHVCGASMGGMIVQAMAIQHRDRLKSLTSIMSTTGDPDLPEAKPEAMAALMAPQPDGEEQAVERAIRLDRVIGSPGFESDAERTTRKAIAAYRRSFYPPGVARQLAAIAAGGDRTGQLKQLDIPALVIHGTDDPLIPVECGKATHDCLRGSELLLIEGMGHDLPVAVWDEIAARITALTTRAD